MVVGVPPPPTAIPKSFHPVPSIYRAILVNIPSLKKKAESREKKKKEHPTPALRCPHTRRGRCEGGGRRGHGFHVPGHSHPVGGGLPHSTPSHHPAGRILTGKTGAGAEEGAGARVRRGPEERGSSPGNTVHANRVTARLRWGRVLKAWGPGPSGHATGEGVWGPSCAAAVHLAGRDQAKTKQVPAPPPLASTNQKPQVEKGDSFFLSKTSRLKETTDCKLPSLL